MKKERKREVNTKKETSVRKRVIKEKWIPKIQIKRQREKGDKVKSLRINRVRQLQSYSVRKEKLRSEKEQQRVEEKIEKNTKKY